jgi:VanZ family protein
MEHESDKLAHFLAYSGFALLAIIVVRTKAQYLICCLLICLYGGSLEFIQSLIPHRSMSFADVFANCIGVAAGYLLVKTHLSGPEFNT